MTSIPGILRSIRSNLFRNNNVSSVIWRFALQLFCTTICIANEIQVSTVKVHSAN